MSNMIKNILDNLLPQEKRQLLYALDNELSQYIELPKGRFIGVNTSSIKYLENQETVGSWSYGVIKTPPKETV